LPETPDGPLTRDDALELMRGDTSPLAVSSETIRGVEYEVFTHVYNDLRDIFTFSNTHYAEREFLIYGDERLTFGEVHRKSVALAHSLQSLRVQPGDRVAISMRNYPEYCLAIEAILAVGAVVVPLNSWWQGEELDYGLRDSGACFAFVDHERWLLIKAFRDRLDLGIAIARPQGDVPKGVLAMADLMEPTSAEEFPPLTIDTDSDAVIMYTSGSTGHPKGVVMTHRNIVNALTNFFGIGLLRTLMQDVDIDARNEVFNWMHGGAAAMDDPIAARLGTETLLVSVPFFHVSGFHTMFLLSYRSGRKLVLMHKWNADNALELIEKEAITAIEGVPTMIGEIIHSPNLKRHDVSLVNRISGGGSARPPEHVKLLQELLPQALPGTGYGMTETNAVGATIGGEEYIARPASVGLATAPLVQIEIRDEDSNILGPNEDGEICIKSSANMRCYWNKPEATEETLCDGWIRSGDLGYVDDEGYIFITGRAKEIIIRGGENIACSEIEYVLYEHPFVNETAVYSAPDERLGEIVCATVYLKPGCESSESEIQDHVRSHLAPFKVPSHVFIASEPLPRIAAGKFDKRALQKQASEALEAQE